MRKTYPQTLTGLKATLAIIVLSILTTNCSNESVPPERLFLDQTPPGNRPKIFTSSVKEGFFASERIAISTDGRIGYYIFAPNVPVVNMAGDPAIIENEADKRESELRNNDPLLVKYFSMHYMTESKKVMDAMVENASQSDYPLLLLYGENDNIVEKAGCDEIYSAWKGLKKKYEIIPGGTHGKSTLFNSAKIIYKWVDGI